MIFPKVGAGPIPGRAGLEGREGDPRIHDVQPPPPPPFAGSDFDGDTRFKVEVDADGVKVWKCEDDEAEEGSKESGSYIARFRDAISC
jgi:hypothetical protein